MKVRCHSKRTIIFSAVVFLFLIIGCLFFCYRHIDQNLLESNEDMALDIAELVKNNFSITDQEVSYMKSLTFNEMEVDDINQRLMDVGNGANLKSTVINVYLVAPLAENEIKYKVDQEHEEDFFCPVGTKLDAIWLLNGILGADGTFIAKQRDDIYRYTHITEELREGFASKKSFGTFSSDEWGEFITGYAPIYTVEGNYVGMLGIDMDPDQYQKDVQSLLFFIMMILGSSIILITILLVIFYIKYTRESGSKIYSEFYSKMSHDMRTPMNGILGMVHLAKKEENVDELHKYFQKVGESSEYLLRLINDTLDVSKISSGKMTLNEDIVSFQSVIDNITDMVKLTANEKNIRFVVEKRNISQDYLVQMDEIRFKQIFINLLSNSLKFTQKGGLVRFEVENVGEENGKIHFRFTVVDTGVGMSEEYIKHSIYRPYIQETNRMNGQSSGSGLGLTITKNLVELMQGSIELESEINQGTTFTVHLDLKKIEYDAQSAKQFQNMDKQVDENCLNGAHVLLCEDHPLNAEIARKILEQKGCLVDIAVNGEIGVAGYQNSKEYYYDIILMDIRMPVMDGLEAVRAIRALPREDAKRIPIVAMTANAYAEDVQNSKEAGMNEHLSKPFNPEELYQTMSSLISAWKMR